MSIYTKFDNGMRVLSLVKVAEPEKVPERSFEVGDWPVPAANIGDVGYTDEECDCPNFTECARNSGCLKDHPKYEAPLTPQQPPAAVREDGWHRGKPPKSGPYRVKRSNNSDACVWWSRWMGNFWDCHCDDLEYLLDDRFGKSENQGWLWRHLTADEEMQVNRLAKPQEGQS